MSESYLISPKNGESVDLHTEIQNAFFAEDRSAWDTETANAHLSSRDCFPEPVVFSWESEEKEDLFELSENEDFSEPIVRRTDEKTLSLTNLKTGTRYFWRVNGGEPFSFTTKTGIRFLFVEGQTNFRDIGGYLTESGKRVRQGMLIRGTGLDRYHPEDHHEEYFPTERGIATLVKELGIKTDLDLRSVPEMPAGEAGYLAEYGIRHDIFPTFGYYGDGNPDPYGHDCALYHDIYEQVLCDPAKYPIYFHCQAGADRTGCLSFYLLAFLGVNENDLLDDYEATILSGMALFRNSERFSKFLAKFHSLPGETTAEKGYYYLHHDCGIPEETLEKVKSILLY